MLKMQYVIALKGVEGEAEKSKKEGVNSTE